MYGITNEGWTESGINWTAMNGVTGTLLSSATMNASTGVWYEFDVTGYMNSQFSASDKLVSFELVNEGAASSQGQVSINSKEAGSNAPQLVIQPRLPMRESRTDIIQRSLYCSHNAKR